MRDLIQMLNHIEPVSAGDERRVWLPSGVAATVGPTLDLVYTTDQQDGEYRPRLSVVGQRGTQVVMEIEPRVSHVIGALGLEVIPLALEYAGGGARPTRVRLQFVRLNQDVRWAS